MIQLTAREFTDLQQLSKKLDSILDQAQKRSQENKDTPNEANDFDPRSSNARNLIISPDSKVAGVYLAHHRNPDTRYYCARAKVLGEGDASGGQVVAKTWVYGKNKKPQEAWITLGIGYKGDDQHFDDTARKYGSYIEHPTVNAYIPPNLGPLAIFLTDENGTIISDVIGSLGLPYGRHISVEIDFRER